jgi:hypothetical protein
MTNSILRRFCFVLLAISVCSATVSAVDVRGRLLLRATMPNMQPYPATGFQVTLAVQTPQGLMAVGVPAYTGSDGMYWLLNINPGQYYLLVVAPNGINWTIPVAVNQGVQYGTPTGPRWVFDIQPQLL